MKRAVITFSGIFLLIASCAETEQPSKTTTKVHFENEIDSLQAYFQIPGMAILVKKDDEIVYEDYVGFSNLEKKTKVDSTTLFPIASLTKVFSGITMMSLAENKKISLEEPANTYFESAPFSDDIQLKHIASHTSQGAVPGKHFYYSSRFGALTKVMETASGQPFENILDSLIIEPLQLAHTFLLKDSTVLKNRDEIFAQPYLFQDSVQKGFVDYGFSASAGIVTTARDLMKLDDALDAHTIISEAAKKSMFTPFKPELPYGYGIFSETFLDNQLIWAYGQYDCYSSLWLKVPSKNLTLILLANNNLMSDPARLIYGNATSSLFVLGFLKHFVLNANGTGTKGDEILYREQLRAGALAASFMAQFNTAEMDVSKKLLHRLFAKYPSYLAYADLSLLHNLSFLKDVALYKELGPFNDFDEEFVKIGEHLLKQDANNPYAHYYLGSFYDKEGNKALARIHFQAIMNAENFSNNWYVSEAKEWLAAHY